MPGGKWAQDLVHRDEGTRRVSRTTVKRESVAGTVADRNYSYDEIGTISSIEDRPEVGAAEKQSCPGGGGGCYYDGTTTRYDGVTKSDMDKAMELSDQYVKEIKAKKTAERQSEQAARQPDVQQRERKQKECQASSWCHNTQKAKNAGSATMGFMARHADVVGVGVGRRGIPSTHPYRSSVVSWEERSPDRSTCRRRLLPEGQGPGGVGVATARTDRVPAPVSPPPGRGLPVDHRGQHADRLLSGTGSVGSRGPSEHPVRVMVESCDRVGPLHDRRLGMWWTCRVQLPDGGRAGVDRSILTGDDVGRTVEPRQACSTRRPAVHAGRGDRRRVADLRRRGAPPRVGGAPRPAGVGRHPVCWPPSPEPPGTFPSSPGGNGRW